MRDDFVIVLARPETSSNIGAVCRVMATTDLCDLRIIGNKDEEGTNMNVLIIKNYKHPT